MKFDFLFDPGEQKEQKLSPHGFILVPVHKEFVEKDPETVGMLIGVTAFGNLLDRLLPEGRDGIIAVLSDSCGNIMSFELSSGKAAFLGYEDLHEHEFEEYERYEPNIEMYEDEDVDGLCVHDLRVYPSSKFLQTFKSNIPAIYAGVVAVAFLGIAFLMLVYDCMVNRRQRKTVKVAAGTQAIVTSLFPKEIARQMVQEAVEDSSAQPPNGEGGTNLDKLGGGDVEGNLGIDSSKPMADLFPDATVMVSSRGMVVRRRWCAAAFRLIQLFRPASLAISSDSRLGLRQENQLQCSCCWKDCIRHSIRLPSSGKL
jgi:hypothetical protein